MVAVLTWSDNPITAGRLGTAAYTGVVLPHALDFLGIHRVGAPDGDLVTWAYRYPAGSRAESVLPAVSAGSQVLTVPPSTPAGSHTVRYYSGLTRLLLAETAAFTINAYDNVVSVSAPASASVNTAITVSWAGIPSPDPADWLGLFRAAGGPLGLFLPAELSILTGGTASGSVSLYLPTSLLPGSCAVRLYAGPADQAPVLYATSGTITIDSSLAPSIASPGDQLAGTLVQAQWANIVSPAPSTQDWVGLFALGAPASAPLGNRYLNGAASGSLPFVIPGYLPTASYELRLYSGADQSLLATSAAFTVTAAP